MNKRILSLVTVAVMILAATPAIASGPHREFVVVLHPTDDAVPDVARQLASQHNGQVGFVYTTALQGFTISVPEQAAAALEGNPRVAYVEPVHQVQATGTQPIPTGIDRIEGDLNPPSVPMDVDIAILDTGVYIGQNPDGSARSHLDLNLRYVSDCTGAIFYPLFGGCSASGDFQDYHGHGTHVAGIAAARDNDIGTLGVAPGATLWSFKVLQADGTGTTGMILAGIDAVAANADQIEVANMSLGFEGTSQAIDDAIAAATNVGVTFVVAAGNSSIDASGFSPANGPDVITVSAIADFDGLPGGLGSPTCRNDEDDTLANFSNYGPAVEIAAPGVCIYSTWLNDGYATLSGTSMASPFVAGAVARYIAESGAPTNNRADVEAIKAAIIGAGVSQDSSCGFADVDSSPEPLLFVNGPLFGGDGSCEDGSVVNAPPLADFSYECTDLTCVFTDQSADSDGNIVSHSWDFGDGATSTEQSPTHAFAGQGTYMVALTVTDDVGASNTITQDVEVIDPTQPNAVPVASFTSSCIDLSCSFTNTSTDPDGDPLTYSWDFGDGATSTATNPSHLYSSAGEYMVTLTADDGTDIDTAMATVTVTEPAGSTLITAAVYPILVDGRDASVSIGVIDGDGEFVGGAVVDGVWTYLDRRGRERTTTDSGVSSDEPVDGLLGNVVINNRFPPNVEVVSFCVTSVTADGYEYQPSTITCSEPFDG
jgi:subtilisin family serine protease